MRRIGLIVIGTGLIFLFSTCQKEHIAPVNQLVKDLFCFKEGSEWTYYDSVSQTTKKMMITEYKITKLAPKPLGGRKAYEWAEIIKIKGHFIADFEVCIRAWGSDNDNTATFSGTYISPNIHRSSNLPFEFRCDANNNFNEIVTFFSEYQVKDIMYKDVYLFDSDGDYSEKIFYYISKHSGLIRCVGGDTYNYFDWILIDKNIQQ